MDDSPEVAREAVTVNFTGASGEARGSLNGALANAFSAIDAELKISLDRRCEILNGEGRCAALPAIALVPLDLPVRAKIRFSPRGVFGGGDAKPDEEILTVISSAGGGYGPAREAELVLTEKDPRLGTSAAVAAAFTFAPCFMRPAWGQEQPGVRQEFGERDD